MSAPFLYSLFVGLGIAVALLIRRSESQRLGYAAEPGFRYVGAGCLIGAALGSKLGMALYLPLADVQRLFLAGAHLDFGGKSILGAIAGGYLGGELAKHWAGVRFSTGDALAVALPVGQAIGRVGCFFGGCCYGKETSVPWAVFSQGALRHPAPLYESAICLAIAAWLWSTREKPTRPGWRFRYYLIAYAAVRMILEEFRGDAVRGPWPITPTQAFCLLAIVALSLSLWLGRKMSPQVAELETQRV